jgi:C-terminal peptidase prc
MRVRAHRFWKPAIWLLAALLAACSPLASESAGAPTPAFAPPSVTFEPSSTPAPTPSVTPAPSSTPTATPSPTPTDIPLTPTPTLAPLPAARRRAIFEQVWALVRDNYVYADYRGLDWRAIRAEYEPRAVGAADPQAFYQAVEEMIARLGDDHSRFESPQEVAEEQARSAGELSYAGIGAAIHVQPDGGVITRLAPGGPAEMAGLRPRDVILAVGGVVFTDTAAFGPGGPLAAVRGTPGTQVALTVRSPGAAPREVVLTRRVIPSDAFPAVEASRLPNTNVALLAITTFERPDTAELVRDQAEALLKAGPLDGLIVDVRDNGGGYIDAMLDTIGLFVNGGTIGTSAGRKGSDKLIVPKGQTIEPLAGVPIVVLIGEDTVSAAEMFAAGMRVVGRARIVGTPSAGNTENLLLHSFDDGSRLWLAEYAYRLPDGSLLEGHGLQPDRLVVAEWWRYPPADDPQVRAALEELRDLRMKNEK